MKHSIFYSTAILLAGLILLGACHKDTGDYIDNGEGGASGGGDDNVSYIVEESSQAPDWKMDWSFNQQRPDWQEPNYTDFEFSSVMLIKMQPQLQPYVSADDMMAFFVEDQLRGLTSPAISVDDETTTSSFVLKVFGNEADNEKLMATILYYSSKLHHLFVFDSSLLFNVNEVIGLTEDYIPIFTLGSSKYPIYMFKNFVNTPLASAGITPSEGDMIGAFVGDECRGIAPLPDSVLFPSTTLEGKDFADIQMTIYGKTEGESVTIKYYDADQGRILIFNDVFKMEKIRPNPYF
jgi:hypothetical protein